MCSQRIVLVFSTSLDCKCAVRWCSNRALDLSIVNIAPGSSILLCPL